MSERMAITAASRTELSVDHLAEEDCEDKLVIDVAPAVSGADQGRPLVGDLTESNLSAAAASRFYSQYAVAQQQYAAALARAATGPYASALGCSYLMAGYPLAPPSTVATAAATSSSSMLLPKVYASPFTIMAAFPSTASAPNFKSDDKATCSAVDQTKQPLGATLSSSSSGGESWSGMSSLSASSSSEEGTIANSGASSSSVIRRSSNTAVNHKAVEEHITRLISENEALLEPSPVLLKRRSYTRQHYGSLDHSTGSTSSSTSSKRQSSTTVKSTRSQSLVDLGLLATFKQRNQDASKKSSEQSSADVDHCFHKCAYCKVGFRNMDSVRAHEIRCAHRSEMPTCSSSNRSSLSPKSASATSEASLASTEASNLFLNRTVGQIDEQVAACTSRTERMYPYCNTVNVPRLVDLEPLRTSQAQALIAQTTFCTVRRRPVFHRRIFESGESVWTNWMPKVNPTGTRIVRNRRDSHLNILLMGCYRLRQKHSPLSYTIAAKQMGNLHVTHSAYWRLCKSRNSNPSAIRQQLAAAAAGREQIKMDPGDDGRSVSCTTSDYCPIEQTQLTVLDASSSTGRVEGSKRSADMPKYIRGRGFGRYVCDRCGIRCKKPSMLKKHLRCHLDVRPYSCGQCSFSFKTKGNLTKHLKSKSHRKRCKRDQVGRIPDGEPSAESQSPVTTSFEDAVENDDFPEEAEEDLSEEEEDDEEDEYDEDDEYDDVGAISDATTGSATEQEDTATWQPAASASPWRSGSPGALAEVSSPSVVVCSSLDDAVKQNLKRCESAPTSSQQSTDGKVANVAAESNCTLQHPVASRLALSSIVDSGGAGSIPSVLGSLDEASMPSNNAQRDIDRYIANSSSEAKPVCVTCGKQFTKFALLRLHMSVHCLEQSSRRYEIKCPECSSSFRSRSLLKKHLACAHPDLRSTLDELGSMSQESQQQNRSGALLSADASDHPQEASVSQKPACNPRPFVCTDCDVAFRIHGHLAKHLRSKLHIMKLESVGKVPIGTFARIEEAGVHYFQEIDTRSGENSLRSLLGLMERFAQTDLPEEKSDDAINRMGEEDDLDDLNDSDELVIDVEGGCSPEESNNNNKSTISGNSTSAVVTNDRAGELDSSKESFEADCSSQLDQADRSDIECAGDLNSLGNVIRLSGRSVVAGVWVPPTSDEFRDSFVFGKCQSSSDSIPVKRPTTNSTSNCVDLDATKRVNSLVAANGGNSLNVSEFAIEAKLENQSVSKNFCQWCDLTYPTWIELMVHRLSDHIIMKDGRDFRCPLANCDRVYPNRDCLRQHLLLHFLGRVKDCVADHAYEVPRSSNGYEFCSDEFSSPPSKIVRRSSSGTLSKRAKTCRKEKTDCYPERNGFSYSSTSDSEASHLSISNNSPVTSPPEGTAPRKQTAKRHSEQATSSSLLASLLPDAKRAVATTTKAHEETRHHLPESAAATVEQQLPVGWSHEGKQLRVSSASAAATLPQSPQRAFVSNVNWNHVSPLLQDSISSRPLFSAAASPAGVMLGNNIADPTMAAMAQTAAVAANPTAFMNYQNLCQHLATASILSAMQQQAQCGSAIGHPLLAALNSGAFNRVSASTIGIPSTLPLPTPLPAGVGSFIPTALCLCLMCGKQFANMIEYQEHMVSHSQPRPFLCDVCDAGFTTARALQAHLPCKQQLAPGQ